MPVLRPPGGEFGQQYEIILLVADRPRGMALGTAADAEVLALGGLALRIRRRRQAKARPYEGRAAESGDGRFLSQRDCDMNGS